MVKKYFLNERQIAQIRELLRAHSHTTTPPTIKEPETDSWQTPDIYVVYPQEEDGVPALEEGETDGDPDIPGEAKCDAYQVVYNADNEPELTEMGLELDVLNLSPIPIWQDWVVAVRAKEGYWYVVGPYPDTEQEGITDEDLIEGQSITVSIWAYDEDEEEQVDTTRNITDVYDGFLYQGLTLPKGTFVRIKYNYQNKRWEITYVPRLSGTLGTTLNYNGTATFNPNDTGVTGTLTVYPPLTLRIGSIASGKYVYVDWSVMKARWEVIMREC